MKFFNCLFLLICIISILSQVNSVRLEKKEQAANKAFFAQTGMKTNVAAKLENMEQYKYNSNKKWVR